MKARFDIYAAMISGLIYCALQLLNWPSVHRRSIRLQIHHLNSFLTSTNATP